jgi:hypothetical protein
MCRRLCRKHFHFGIISCHGQVQLTVTIEVTYGDGLGLEANRVALRGPQCTIAVTQQHAKVFRSASPGTVRNSKVKFAIGVEIPHR